MEKENMWITDDVFLDFKKKEFVFVNQNGFIWNRKPLPKEHSNGSKLIMFLAEYRTKTQFTPDEIKIGIFGDTQYENNNVSVEIRKLRNLLYDKNDPRRDLFLIYDRRDGVYYFNPPLDKLPPDDLEPEGSEQPDKLPPDDLEPEGSEQPEKLPSDDLEPEGSEQPEKLPSDDLEAEGSEQSGKLLSDDLGAKVIEETQCKNDCCDALSTGFSIRIVLICIVGILLHNLFPLVIRRDENNFVVLRPAVYRIIRYSIIFPIMVVAGGFLNNSYGQVIETLVLRIKRRSKYRTYHLAAKALQESAIATRTIRIVDRLIIMVVLVLLYVVNLKQLDKYVDQFMHLSFPTSESSEEEFDVMFDENNQPYGACGDNLQWKIYQDGTMKISGEGEMEDYGWYSKIEDMNQPWRAYKNQISTVTIENGVSYIGHNAFDGCSELKRINIPNSVREIRWETGAFDLCTNLEEITVDTDNEKFVSLDGVLFDKDMKTLIKYPAKKPGIRYEIPDSVVEISAGCFSYCNLETISIPNNVNLIMREAFCDLESVDSIILPENLREIEYNLFYNSAIKSVVIPGNIRCIEESAFYGCEYLTDIYYMGTQEQWSQIVIFNDNDAIYGANIHYNYE